MLCYVMLCYVMLYCVMLCEVTQSKAIWQRYIRNFQRLLLLHIKLLVKTSLWPKIKQVFAFP